MSENEGAGSPNQQTSPERLLLDLDPKTITYGKGPNRAEPADTDPEFWVLVESIRACGGNVQPVKVRLVGSEGPLAYELVYGHRRVLACQHLGIKVKAEVVAGLTDAQALVQQMSENSGRLSFRPIEIGRLALYALDSGAHSSLRSFGSAVGVDVALISKAVALARLPTCVLSAFSSPQDLQYQYAKPLGDALIREPKIVEARAGEICKMSPRPKAATVLKMLLGNLPERGVESFNTSHPVTVDGTEVGRLTAGRAGISLTLKREVAPKDLEEFARSFGVWLKSAARAGKTQKGAVPAHSG